MTNEQLYKYVGSNFLNEEIAAYAKDKQKLMSITTPASPLDQYTFTKDSDYDSIDNSTTAKYWKHTYDPDGGLNRVYQLEMELIHVKAGLQELNQYISEQDKYIIELERQVAAMEEMVQAKVDHMTALLERFEGVFKQPGCQIVFDNGRIEHPERLIELTL